MILMRITPSARAPKPDRRECPWVTAPITVTPTTVMLGPTAALESGVDAVPSNGMPMAGPAVEFAYRYRGRSALHDGRGGPQLALATFCGEAENPYFFEGRAVRPRLTAELLRSLMEVVRARFHVPAAMLAKILAAADPVVTCNDERLRFEAFSGCASAYARIDFTPEAVETDSFG